MLMDLHVGNCLVRQLQAVSSGAALRFIFHGVNLVSERLRCQRNNPLRQYGSCCTLTITRIANTVALIRRSSAGTSISNPVITDNLKRIRLSGRRFTRMSGEWKKKSRITRLAEKSLRSLLWPSSPPVCQHWRSTHYWRDSWLLLVEIKNER